MTFCRPPERPDRAGSRQAPQWYVIDVCAVCGKQAQWPFCEHRREDRAWTAPLSVKPTKAGRRAVQAAMDIAASEASS